MYFSVNSYSSSERIGCNVFGFDKSRTADRVEVTELSRYTAGDAVKTDIVFTFKKDTVEKTAVSVVFEEENIGNGNYVFAPAALYNGNKYRSIEMKYPPMFTKEQALLCGDETFLSDVPRLGTDGNGRVQLSVGDLSAACVGYFSEAEKSGMLLFFNQRNEAGDFGIDIEENTAGGTESFTLTSPCVREKYKYSMCSTKEPSDDSGICFKAGDKLTFSFYEYRFPCDSINAFLNKFFELRTCTAVRGHPDCVPWSYAYGVVEGKYNHRNWVENPGFYKSSEAEGCIACQWQTGWVGGCINTLPGLILGNPLTRERSRKTLDFVFDTLQHESGFLYGIFCDGRAYGDSFRDTEDKNIVMSRKNADALYFLAKQLIFMRESGETVSGMWEAGLKKLADAFCRFFRMNGEFGQFINISEMNTSVPGSASAAIAPAGLVLCSEYFGCKEYSEIASRAAAEYYEKYVKKGYTNGGPGEILACPDSESAFAALESFVTLYTYTEDASWLKMAVDCASLCSSWCVAYDYQFGRHTQLYKRKVSVTGAVWANVQNKHAAPGICTLSAASLFRLFRATGNIKYLELCRDISHNITQYVSLPDKPYYASYIWHNGRCASEKEMNAEKAARVISRKKGDLAYEDDGGGIINPIGRINERVNLSDWEGKNNVGEVPLGSCWPEVSLMLTVLEVPGIYICRDTGFCYAVDHVVATAERSRGGTAVLTLTNPTEYDAEYRFFVEDSTDLCKPVSDFALQKLCSVKLRAHETKAITV